eukprot:CAMPEP_0182946568 /NCGR_PEP_ID=MMETSP0105_2-20130417/57240_1 /TAXON_ID=81532 ORGANISM="Acanthoeca-like sp., Strain 10tr" /NCGR_SAMPLE_ID=MMETSP0105_2 /ASSEMBLY_ACC=CAM_ASM_000205 /LENGTH=36 /DNA_ID= /DNA_START= /DNA_END= /DNA_ORIENTATION=
MARRQTASRQPLMSPSCTTSPLPLERSGAAREKVAE